MKFLKAEVKGILMHIVDCKIKKIYIDLHYNKVQKPFLVTCESPQGIISKPKTIITEF